MAVNENEMGGASDEDGGEGDVSGRAAARRAMRDSKRQALRPPTLRRKMGAPPEGETPSTHKAEPVGPARTPATTRPARETRGDDYKDSRGRGRLSRRRLPDSSLINGAQREETAEPKPTRPVRREPARPVEEYQVHTHPDGTSQRVKVTGGGGRPAPVRRKAREDTHGAGPAIVDMSKLRSFSRTGRGAQGFTGDPKVSAEALRRVFGVDPKVAVILGSGLSSAASLVSGKAVAFSEIPGFSAPGVSGHPGELSCGDVNGVSTLFCEGRVHYYECGSMEVAAHPVRTFIEMGVQRLIITTSAGALNPEYKLGDIMFVQDHINMMGDNPMFGGNPQMEPSVFVDFSEVYSKLALEKAESLLRRSRARGHIGVLAATRGPVYETVAERKFLRVVGADAVCMSTIPEVIVAAYAGVKVTALAVIVNAAGSQAEPLTHDSVAKAGKRHCVSLKRLIANIIGEKW